MKKHPSGYRLFVLLAFSLLGISQASFGVGGTVFWHNLSDNSCPQGTSPGVINDVVDCNIDVIGTNALVEGIHVVAQTQDILITVTNEDSVITGSGNRCDMVPTNSARLYLFADENRTITFQLTWDLLFRGASDQGFPLDLLVSVSGGGLVRFCIEGGNEVCFTSIPESGGTQVFIGMGDPLQNESPKLRFKRLDPVFGNTNENIEVKVGPNSCITYIAERAIGQGDPDETGCISYDGANTGPGCNILRLEDCSSLIIWGHHLEEVTLDDDFMLDNINLAVPAGFLASFVIENSIGGATASSVRVINDNRKCPNLLIDPFCDNAFTGTQFGFVLGVNGLLQTNNCTYLDYIGTVTNSVPEVNTPFANLQPKIQDLIDCGEIEGPEALIKSRNCSAFFVDGLANQTAFKAEIHLSGTSAIYFRSGVDCEGDVSPDFTIDPGKEEPGAGNIVFDVEGPLLVRGEENQDSALNVLSLQVTKTGCPIFVETQGKPIFPMRTFAKDTDGKFRQYNKGAFLINNCMEMRYTSLLHTDEIHEVFQNNNLGRSDLSSEPTYIGGEHWKLCNDTPECPDQGLILRPTISLNNSIFRVHTNVGLTGVDICVSNTMIPASGNRSIFRFYNNGRAIDNAYGRVYIAGTNIGSLSACGFLIDNTSHIDVFQKTYQTEPPGATAHLLSLDVGFNDTCITPGIVGDISGQCAVHEIFLNNASNISIGTDGEQGTDIKNNCDQFDLVTTPSLCIAGEFFSFNTAGGLWALPQASGTTGQGGIFVDKNGTIKSACRASFSTMVTRSRNGVVDLPKNQVFFTNRVGITVWQPNLTDSDQRVLVPSGACLSNFSMDWGALKKDYTTSNSFVPYELKCTPNPCECPPVLCENLRALPLVKGDVDQFQILRSRIGDQAHLQVTNGARIRELTFLLGCNPAEAAVGFLVVQDDARIGLGSADLNKDSNCANVVLGVNGITICANGDGTIELNEDVLINNVCHIVSGTSFGVDGPECLNIFSEDEHELRVKSTGLLDLTQFNNENKILKFTGKVRLIFEPGSRLVLGGGVIDFTDETQLLFERVLDPDDLSGAEPSDLDNVRVKIIGRGLIIQEEDAICQILQNQFVGVEADTQCSLVTSITWLLLNQAKMQIGTASRPGGSFQVGNTTCLDNSTVDLTVILNGVGTIWELNRQGFMGLGVGMADKASQIPNQWLVNCLENLFTVSVEIREGTFQHNQIKTGDVNTASLLAIGPADQYTWLWINTNGVILGGGNMVQITNCIDGQCGVDELKKLEVEKLSSEKCTLVREASVMMERAERMMQEAKEMMKSASVTRGPSRNKKLESAREMITKSRTMKTKAEKLVRNLIISAINPTVQNTAGVINNNLQVGILSGRLLLIDKNNDMFVGLLGTFRGIINALPQAFFDFLSTLPYDSQNSPRANIFRDQVEISTLGFLDDISGTLVNPNIRRDFVQEILSSGNADESDHDHSLRIGAVALTLDDANRTLNKVTEMRAAQGF